MKKLRIFIIAGEVSGDRLGGGLMAALKRKVAGNGYKLEFFGIGWDKMIKEGLKLTSPMKNIGLIGLIEIIPHFFKLRSIIKATAKYIDDWRPDLVITIDSWGFCSRVIDRIKSRENMKLVHYVSPTIWAYRKYRIRKLERLYDLVLSIFPFEAKYYEGRNIECKYVGHPLVEAFTSASSPHIPSSSICTSSSRSGDAGGRKILGVMVGSRDGEVARLLPIFIEAINKFLDQIEDSERFLIVFPAVNGAIANKIKGSKAKMKFRSLIVDTSKIKEDDRINMIRSFDLALVKSGTSSLELTISMVPMVVAYKIDYFSEAIARHILGLDKNIQYVSMTNIMLGEEAIEEFLQKKCTSANLAQGLLKLLDPDYRKKQLLNYSRVVSMLSNEEHKKPNDIAAERLLKLVD